MSVSARFDHLNINVCDLERSIHFYNQALGLKEARRKIDEKGAFILVYLTDGVSPFALELTWLKAHTEPYKLGENESHLCFRVSGDYDVAREYHRQMGCICYENHEMGLYFIADPDGYWIEILPQK